MVDEENENYSDHELSFFWQYFAGPNKILASYTVLIMAVHSIAGQSGAMAFFGIPLIPNIIWEWPVNLISPYLDVPPIPFEEWGVFGQRGQNWETNFEHKLGITWNKFLSKFTRTVINV